MPATRRVVTAVNDDGRSYFAFDEPTPHVFDFGAAQFHEIWADTGNLQPTEPSDNLTSEKTALNPPSAAPSFVFSRCCRNPRRRSPRSSSKRWPIASTTAAPWSPMLPASTPPPRSTTSSSSAVKSTSNSTPAPSTSPLATSSFSAPPVTPGASTATNPASWRASSSASQTWPEPDPSDPATPERVSPGSSSRPLCGPPIGTSAPSSPRCPRDDPPHPVSAPDTASA